MEIIEVAELIRSAGFLGAAFFIGMAIGMFLGAKLLTWIIKKRIEKDPELFKGI
jgi:hypothetical protein